MTTKENNVAREFRMSTSIALPEPIFAEAAMLSRLEVAVVAFSDALQEIIPGALVDIDVVQPKPRGENAAGDPVAQYAALGGVMPKGAHAK